MKQVLSAIFLAVLLAGCASSPFETAGGEPAASGGPDLQLVEVNGARRGALPGGDARHMLLQDSLLGALAVQVIWGLCWAASRTLGTLDQR